MFFGYSQFVQSLLKLLLARKRRSDTCKVACHVFDRNLGKAEAIDLVIPELLFDQLVENASMEVSIALTVLPVDQAETLDLLYF